MLPGRRSVGEHCCGHRSVPDTYALKALEQGGVAREKVECPPAKNEDFSGEWIADLKWIKSDVPNPETSHQLKIVIADAPRVFAKKGADWMEIKSGKFKFEQRRVPQNGQQSVHAAGTVVARVFSVRRRVGAAHDKVVRC